MGLRDNIRDKIDSAVDGATDEVADRTDKRKTGFNADVCEGCPHRGDPPLQKCGLCGCPTLDGFPLDQMQMTPEGCPRAIEHERRS